MMFFADRTTSIHEMARVLVPGGRLVVGVWDALENSPAYSRVVALLQRQAGTRAADALRAPFVLGDARNLERMFTIPGIGAMDVFLGRMRERSWWWSARLP